LNGIVVFLFSEFCHCRGLGSNCSFRLRGPI
jgi:hypothetical protein